MIDGRIRLNARPYINMFILNPLSSGTHETYNKEYILIISNNLIIDMYILGDAETVYNKYDISELGEIQYHGYLRYVDISDKRNGTYSVINKLTEEKKRLDSILDDKHNEIVALEKEVKAYKPKEVEKEIISSRFD